MSKLMGKTKKELVEMIELNNRITRKARDGSQVDIYIRMRQNGSEIIKHLIPESYEYNLVFLDEFTTKESISWITFAFEIFKGSNIDKRCKTPEAIIKSITKKAGLK